MLASRTSDRRADDARLVARLRHGDETAFDTIVGRYRPRLVAFARSILRSRPDAAEDVVQEALMRAHRALLRDDRAMVLEPWLFKLTRNCALDEISRVRADTVELDSPAALPALIDHDDPADVHERRASTRAMLEGIATLPDEQRHALLRREVDGASHADIAAELGITGAASRSLVLRARTNLVKREAALDARCSVVQDDLLRASRTGRRASAHDYRHLATCRHCRAYRGQLRAMRDALHALHPGGLLLLGAAVAKLGLTGKGVVAGVAAKSPVAIGTVAALTAAAAIGTTIVISAGQPSPATIHSPVLPGGVVLKGAALPRHTAVTITPVVLRRGTTTVAVRCPADYRVADLLAPDEPNVTAGYVSGTLPGIARAARVALTGPPGRRVSVAMLCGVPSAGGALTPAFGAQAHVASSGALLPPVVCVNRDYLRSSPAGGVIGSVRSGEPLRIRHGGPGWVRVQTQFGATGWLPSRDLCG